MDDIAEGLRNGSIAAEEILVEVFRTAQGQLVAINNRGLAALSRAGLRPRHVRLREPTPGEKARLDEGNFWGEPLPSHRIAVTRFERTATGERVEVFVREVRLPE